MLEVADGALGHSAWQFHPHPDVWLVFGTIALGYLYLVHRHRSSSGEPGATQIQKLSFFAGLTILWFGADWPMHDLAEDYLFSVHMVQHTLFSLVAPAADPDGDAEVAASIDAPSLYGGGALFHPAPHSVRTLQRRHRRDPLAAGREPLGDLRAGTSGIHLVLVFAALVMWWVVVTPLPELGGLTPPGKMLFLFGQSILPTVPASFLTFANSPIYDVVRICPAPLGYLGSDRSDGRRFDHEDRGRFATVVRHRVVVLRVVFARAEGPTWGYRLGGFRA